MLPLLQGSVPGVSFNDLEVERDKFLSCARVQVSASMYVIIPLSCSLRIENPPPRNTPTRSTPRALWSLLMFLHPLSFKRHRIFAIATLTCSSSWAAQIVDVVEMNDRSTDETYATRTSSAHLSVHSLSDPPQIGGPPQIPLLRPNGQPLTTFQRVHARIGLGTKSDTLKPPPRAIVLLGGPNIFTIWT